MSGSSVVLMLDGEVQTFITYVVDTPWDNFTIERGMVSSSTPRRGVCGKVKDKT